MFVDDAITSFQIKMTSDLRVTDIGKSLLKLDDHLKVGSLLSTHVRMTQPYIELNLDSISECDGQLVEIELRASGIKLRGQFLVLEDKRIRFIGSPVASANDETYGVSLSSEYYAPAGYSMSPRATDETDCESKDTKAGSASKLEAGGERSIHLAGMTEESGDLVMLINTQGQIASVSATEPYWLPIPPDKMIGREISECFPNARSAIAKAMNECARSQSSTTFPFRTVVHGRSYIFDAKLSRTKENQFRFVGKDVTETQHLRQRLRQTALLDGLTGLPNRIYFEQEVKKAVAEAKHVGIITIELDDFKLVNDCHGHAFGDKLLIEVARILRSAMRSSDVPARLGGDEFGILTTSCHSADILLAVGRRISSLLHRRFSIGGVDYAVSACVGVALNDQGDSYDVLWRNADIAVYRAKTQAKLCNNLSAKERVVLFEPAMFSSLVSQFALKEEMRGAVRRSEIINSYQTIHDLSNGQIVGIEALARWQHPQRGPIPPDQFIGIAEASGMIHAVGRAVLNSACHDLRQFSRELPSPLSVNVNVSAVQLRNDDIVRFVDEALRESECNPKFLTLEVTETAMIDEFKEAVGVIRSLKSLGVRLALDDFGVGYSTLKYLEMFPIDVLKLDRSFLEEIDVVPAKCQLVEAIVRLCAELGLVIVGEGVERESQADLLRSFGCPLAQGYFFSKPMFKDPLSEFMRTHNGKQVAQPAPGHKQQAPGHKQPAPGHKQPAPGPKQPQSTDKPPAPLDKQRAPAHKQPVLNDKQSAPNTGHPPETNHAVASGGLGKEKGHQGTENRSSANGKSARPAPR